MIYINKETTNKLNNIDINDLYVVMDFDRTITSYESCSTFGVFGENNFIDENYSIKSKELFDYYYAKEKDINIDSETKNNLMIDWWNKNINLIVESKLKEEKVNNAINKEIMEFRKYGKEFLELMYKKNIPVIIISAGIGDFIEQFLKLNNCLFDNIYIFSNYLKFNNGCVSGIFDEVIHSENKDIVMLNKEALGLINNRSNILLFGDNLSDVRMVPDNKRDQTIRVGFLDKATEDKLLVYRKEFDIVCTEDTSYDEVLNYIKF